MRENRGGPIQEDVSYLCESCGEEIVIPLDLSQGSSQAFSEDCPVCCRPNFIRIEVSGDMSVEIWSETEQF